MVLRHIPSRNQWSSLKIHLPLIDDLPNRYLIRFPDFRHLYQEVNPAPLGISYVFPSFCSTCGRSDSSICVSAAHMLSILCLRSCAIEVEAHDLFKYDIREAVGHNVPWIEYQMFI